MTGKKQSAFAGVVTRQSWIKNVLLIIGLTFGAPDIAQRLASLGLSTSLLAYLGLFVALAACLWAAAQIKQHFLRWIVAIILAAASFVMDSFAEASDEMLSYDAFVNLAHSTGFVGDAVHQHWGAILWAGTKSFFLFFGVGLVPAGKRFITPFQAVGATLAGSFLLTIVLFMRGGEGGKGLPSAWVGASYASLFLYEAASNDSGPRKSVSMPRTDKPVARDIVLIIDESIAGHYLDINNKYGVRSGLAGPVAGVSISNFGIAASGTNCSIGSNQGLQFGGTRTNYQKTIASMPSIWSYAKKAGLSTIYIDAQRDGGGLQNGMTTKDLRSIDRFVQFDKTTIIQRDMAAVDAIAASLNNTKAEFILVNKVGAHFPIADKYPDSYLQYKPAMPRGQSLNVADVNMRHIMVDGPENWRLYRNSYRNTVQWNVGAFFDRLFAKSKIGEATIIYTSDHGQDLHERGNPGSITHCHPEPQVEEGVVPLLVIEKEGSNRWKEAATRNFNGSSHFRIFPTLLTEMGYDKPSVAQIYGEGLDASKPDPLTFNTLFNARLGRAPIWRPIKPEKIVQPPVSDY